MLNDFVTSIVAPIATGWSDSCGAGFAPAERQRLPLDVERVLAEIDVVLGLSARSSASQ